MICPNCYTDNRADAKFCNECGCDLRGYTASESADVDDPLQARATSAASVVADALAEVKSLRDAVPPVIKVPTLMVDELKDVSQKTSQEEPSKELAGAKAYGKAGEEAVGESVDASALEKTCDAGADASASADGAENTPATLSAAASHTPDPAVTPSPASVASAASVPSDTVFAEARAMFGPKDIPSSGVPSAEVTADLTGFERLVDSSYVPPTYSGRSGDTMELPRIEGETAPAALSFRAEVDRKELRRQKKAQRKLEREQAKREKELKRQQGVAPAAPAPAPLTPPAAANAASPARSGSVPVVNVPEVVTDEHPAPHASAPQRTVSAEEPKRKMSAGKRAAIVIAVLLVVVAAVAGGTYALEMWGGKKIPDVVGRSQADAQYLLEDKGFATAVALEKSDGVEGIVLSTDPPVGARADKGATILMSVSSARVVPNVTGLSQEDAAALIASEGFENVTFTTVKSNEPEGSVLSVSPESGTKGKADLPITVEVAESYVVPDVAGLDSDEAASKLAAEGYEVVVKQYNTEDMPEGTAVSTDPVAGTKYNTGGEVVLYVAHNRSTELVSLTRAFFTDSPQMNIGGVVYRVDTSTLSLAYEGNDTVSFSASAVELGFIFGIAIENPNGPVAVSGSITWNDDNTIASTTPSMRQGA